jgi:tRNA pseudouridine13 synthase
MREYAYDFAPLSFRFVQDPEHFYVEELPLRPAEGRGKWIMLRIIKKEMSSRKLVNILQNATGASEREIGYAGLKDKSSTSIQYITLPARCEKRLGNIRTPRIGILSVDRASEPLKIGRLAGNRFRILLENIQAPDAEKLLQYALAMAEKGIPNHFGYQRFGKNGRGWEQGRRILHSGKRLRGSREKLLAAAWQSRLFNDWLDERIRISRMIGTDRIREAARLLQSDMDTASELKNQAGFFKLLRGDLMRKACGGKLHICRSPAADAKAFAEKKLVPTGLLGGSRVPRAARDAGRVEYRFDDDEITSLGGNRRAAWIWPTDIEGNYDSAKLRLSFSFSLPPGSYATTFLEQLGRRSVRPPQKAERGANQRKK